MRNYRDIGDFIKWYNSTRVDALRQLPTYVDKASSILVDDIRKRVTVDKYNYAYGRFSPYSKSHAYARRRRGLDTDNKNFLFKGVMFNTTNFGINSSKSFGNKHRVIIGFKGANRRNNRTNIANSRLLEIHSEREGVSIIATTVEEEKKLVESVTIDLFNFLKRELT